MIIITPIYLKILSNLGIERKFLGIIRKFYQKL